MEEIVTGEAVILDLPYARFPTRLLARLLDVLVEIVILVVLSFITGIAVATHALNGASSAAVLLGEFVLVIVGYPIACETLSRGRSVGKLALGLRVVADDGGPERFRHALVRALAGAVECWALFGVPALITSMLSARGKRLGDVFGGTFVVRERVPRAVVANGQVHPSLRPWAASLELSAVGDQLAATASGYLTRFWQLNEVPRERLGTRLAADVAARVSPPAPSGLSAGDYLYTVLAERRTREFARLTASAGNVTAAPARGPAAPPSPPPAAPAPPDDNPFTPPG